MKKEQFIESLMKFKSDGVSICIPAYKAQDFIEECLDSIQNQTYFKYNDNYEILVGIDGCEETLKKVNEIRHKYKNLSVFYGENRGCPITRNSLINQAKFENIITFDSDDFMCENMVDQIIKSNSDFCRYCYLYDVIDEKMKNPISNYYSSNNFPKDIFVHNRRNDYLVFGSVYFKKSLWKELNGFSNLRYCDDTDLDLRLEKYCQLNKLKYVKLNEKLMIIRMHTSSITHNKPDVRKKQIEIENEIKNRVSRNNLKNEKLLLNETFKKI